MRYNWLTKNYMYLMYKIWWIWTYTNTHDTITTIKVIDIPKTYEHLPVFLCSFGLQCACFQNTTWDFLSLQILKCTTPYFLLVSLVQENITQHHIFNYKHYVLQQISRTYSSSISETVFRITAPHFLHYNLL